MIRICLFIFSYFLLVIPNLFADVLTSPKISNWPRASDIEEVFKEVSKMPSVEKLIAEMRRLPPGALPKIPASNSLSSVSRLNVYLAVINLGLSLGGDQPDRRLIAAREKFYSEIDEFVAEHNKQVRGQRRIGFHRVEPDQTDVASTGSLKLNFDSREISFEEVRYKLISWARTIERLKLTPGFVGSPEELLEQRLLPRQIAQPRSLNRDPNAMTNSSDNSSEGSSGKEPEKGKPKKEESTRNKSKLGDQRTSTKVVLMPVEVIKIDGDKVWLQNLKEENGEVIKVDKPTVFQRDSIRVNDLEKLVVGQRLVAQISLLITEEFVEFFDRKIWDEVKGSPVAFQFVVDPLDVVSRAFREESTLTELDNEVLKSLSPAKLTKMEATIKDPKKWQKQSIRPGFSSLTLRKPWRTVTEYLENIPGMHTLLEMTPKEALNESVRKDVAKMRSQSERYKKRIFSTDEEEAFSKVQVIEGLPRFKEALSQISKEELARVQKCLKAIHEGNALLAERFNDLFYPSEEYLEDIKFDDDYEEPGPEFTDPTQQSLITIQFTVKEVVRIVSEYEQLGFF